MTVFRDRKTLSADGLMPTGNHGLRDFDFPSSGIRVAAAVEVLLRLPQPQYDVLVERKSEWNWFIPHYQMWGRVSRLLPVITVYLNPNLEVLSIDACIGLVAHELSHLILDHADGNQDWKTRESDANDLLASMGFAEEFKLFESELKRTFNAD